MTPTTSTGSGSTSATRPVAGPDLLRAAAVPPALIDAAARPAPPNRQESCCSAGPAPAGFSGPPRWTCRKPGTWHHFRRRSSVGCSASMPVATSRPVSKQQMTRWPLLVRDPAPAGAGVVVGRSGGASPHHRCATAARSKRVPRQCPPTILIPARNSPDRSSGPPSVRRGVVNTVRRALPRPHATRMRHAGDRRRPASSRRKAFADAKIATRTTLNLSMAHPRRVAPSLRARKQESRDAPVAACDRTREAPGLSGTEPAPATGSRPDDARRHHGDDDGRTKVA